MKYLALILLILIPLWSHAQPVSETGLPLPRFASLKGDEANMRNGPGKRYPIKWSYRREGLPVMIINEYEHWRQIEDSDGIKGWMHKTVLSGRRTALIRSDDTLLFNKPNSEGDVIAKLMKNVVVDVQLCRRDWCEVIIDEADGWLPTESLWGGILPD